MRKLFHSYLGQLLAVMNFILALYIYFKTDDNSGGLYFPLSRFDVCAERFVAGVYVDPYSTVAKIFRAVNIIPMMVSHLITDMIAGLFLNLSVETISFVYAYLLLGFCLIQWLLVGRFAEKMINIKRGLA